MKSKIISVILSLGLWISSLSADMLKKGKVPISIDTPTTTLVGKMVKLSGNSLPKMGKVKLEIIHPSKSGKSVKSVSVGNNGYYVIDFKETKKAGEYLITAWAPDGKKSVKTTLKVVNLGGMSNQMMEKSIALVNAIAENMPLLEEKLALLPASPATEEAEKKLKKISSKIEEGKSKMVQLKNDFKKVNDFIKKIPNIVTVLEPMYEEMSESAQFLDTKRIELEEKFKLYASKKPTKCDDVDMIVSGLEFASGSMQLLLFEFTKSETMLDKTMELLSKTELNAHKNTLGDNKTIPDAEIQAGKGIVQAAIDSLDDRKAWIGSSVGIINSAMGYIASKMLEVYCEKYTGDFTAELIADFYAYDKKWWGYTITLKGKLNLRYEKGTGSGSVRVSGEFEGNAEKFHVWDDFMSATPYMNRHVVFHMTTPPVTVPYAHEAAKVVANEFGKMGRYGFGPYAFLVPVHGIIDGKKMKLEVDSAVKDYGSNVKGTAWYVLVEPSMPLVPYVMTTELPMVKAGFILSRGLRGKATFDIGIDKKRSAIKKVFNRTVKAENGEHKIVWKVEVKACNPECLK